MTNSLHSLTTSLCDGLFSLLSDWPPVVLLVVISAIVGLLMAIVFRYTSQQKALREVADRSRAQVLAIKLFKDELGTMFVSLGQLLRYTSLRLWYSLPPALVMFVPFVLLLTQMARWYEQTPLVPQETAVLEMQFSADAWPQAESLVLETSDGLIVETLPVPDDEDRTYAWGVRAVADTSATIRWKFGQEEGEKQITIAKSKHEFIPVDARRAGPGFLDRVLHPGEPGFDGQSSVQAINVYYVNKTRSTPLLGFDIPWWLTFFLVSMIVAVLVRPLVKVQF